MSAARRVTRCAWLGIEPSRRCGECKAGYPEQCARVRDAEVFSTDLGSPLEWLPRPASERRLYTEVLVAAFGVDDIDTYDRLKAAGKFLASNA